MTCRRTSPKKFAIGIKYTSFSSLSQPYFFFSLFFFCCLFGLKSEYSYFRRGCFVSPSECFSLFAFSKANFSKVGFGCLSSLDFVQITIIFWGEFKKVLNGGMEHITVAVAVAV